MIICNKMTTKHGIKVDCYTMITDNFDACPSMMFSNTSPKFAYKNQITIFAVLLFQTLIKHEKQPIREDEAAFIV